MSVTRLTQQADVLRDPGAALEPALPVGRGQRGDERQAGEHQERHLDTRHHPGRPVHPPAGTDSGIMSTHFRLQLNLEILDF